MIARRSRTGGRGIALSERGGSIVIEGQAPSYQEKVEIGWAAAKLGFKGVVNDLSVEGAPEETLSPPLLADSALEGAYYDVVIVGGGVIGSAVARELTRLDLSVALLEKESDVAAHTSSRNDGMVHDGFAAKPGSKKAAYNVRGNRLWEPLCAELGVEFKRPGSLILFGSALSAAAYPVMAERARRNGVDGWEFWSRARVAAEEPNVAGDQHGAFFLPSAGVLSPYKATVALAESAIMNGARVFLDTCVLGMELESGRIARVRTNRGACRAGVVVNAAGNWSDVVAGMAGDRFFSLHQRRGTEAILDADTGRHLRHIMGMPRLVQIKSKTKGGGLVPTVEGNVLVGPTAAEAPGREDYSTRAWELRELEKHVRLNTRLAMGQAITYFAGVRPCTYEEDFVVERSERVPNLVHAAGIQSPGLASAPAIAEDVARMVAEIASGFRAVRPRDGWKARRSAAPEPRRLGPEARNALILGNPAYGRIVCRCEEVSEGEIVDAVRSVLPVSSMDAVKRRTRAGMGRCHGGFCTPRVMEIVARETGSPLWAVTKKGPGSELCVGPTKGARV
ncbi:MAG: NAD(P)/FAD-dependent oxidoreductase [Spirochaetes bacterium]|nr:NAD(P)/FAD-dependent oxidoreductase [Spirochaetota bacterium]MBU1079318.1 NAD(P)/FAD-dependent oxidoreductase [Spirochaetota bacterium]